MKKKDLAIGSYEAAGLLGVREQTPGKMAQRGELTVKMMASARQKIGLGNVAYSSAECERNFAQYVETRRDGKYRGLPRKYLHRRPETIKMLKEEEIQIEFSDACSAAEAMQIMRLKSTSQVTRLLRSGEIIGRRPQNKRAGGEKIWIISRQSCEERKKRIIAEEKSGTKPGRRKFVPKPKAVELLREPGDIKKQPG